MFSWDIRTLWSTCLGKHFGGKVTLLLLSMIVRSSNISVVHCHYNHFSHFILSPLRERHMGFTLTSFRMILESGEHLRQTVNKSAAFTTGLTSFYPSGPVSVKSSDPLTLRAAGMEVCVHARAGKWLNILLKKKEGEEKKIYVDLKFFFFFFFFFFFLQNIDVVCSDSEDEVVQL